VVWEAWGAQSRPVSVPAAVPVLRIQMTMTTTTMIQARPVLDPAPVQAVTQNKVDKMWSDYIPLSLPFLPRAMILITYHSYLIYLYNH
jgi:hypothetical protein